MKIIKYCLLASLLTISTGSTIAQTVSCNQLSHHQIKRERTELAKGIYGFVGYSSSNFGIVRTSHGYILIDTGDDIDGVRMAKQEIEKLAPGSLQAIILTHSHPDHRGGADVFIEGEKGTVPVWAHHDFGAEQKTMKGLTTVASKRFSRQFGSDIPDSLFTPNFMTPRFEENLSHQTTL